MEIWIRNECETIGIDEQRLQTRAASALDALGCKDAELSVLLCDDRAIRELHVRYFGQNTPTNVISFSQREGEFGEVEPELLGDVVISLETARRDAAETGKPLDEEIAFLLIHGILHLLGYDHEGEAADRAPEMEAKETELFRRVLAES
jgi:probable rRNA maturation factor